MKFDAAAVVQLNVIASDEAGKKPPDGKVTTGSLFRSKKINFHIALVVKFLKIKPTMLNFKYINDLFIKTSTTVYFSGQIILFRRNDDLTILCKCLWIVFLPKKSHVVKCCNV